jgi:hypothetical protein
VSALSNSAQFFAQLKKEIWTGVSEKRKHVPRASQELMSFLKSVGKES